MTQTFCNLFLIFLTTITLCFAITEIPTTDKSLNRLSYGVYFSHISKYRPVSEFWHFSYSVKIMDVWQAKDSIDIITETLLQKRIRLLNSQDKCTIHPEDYEFDPHCNVSAHYLAFAEETAMQAHEMRDTLLSAIKAIVNTPPPLSLRQARDDWNPLHMVGRLASSIFGLVSTEDLEKAYSAIQEIVKDRNQNVDVIKKLSNDFSSYVTLADKQLQRIEQEANSARVQTLNLIRQVHDSSISYIQTTSAFATQAGKIQNLINSVINSYSLLLSALQMIHVGVISPTLLPPETLSESLEHVKQELNKIKSNSILTHDDLSYYYTKAKYTFVMFKDHLVITLFIPLSSLIAEHDVYEIKTFALSMHDSNSPHTLRIQKLPEAVAISNVTKTFFHLELNDLEIIKHGKEISPVRVFTKFDPTNCLSALYLDNTHAVNISCIYAIDLYSKAPFITHLAHSTFILFNIHQYSLTCQDTEHTVIGCELCARRIPSGCSMTSNNLLLPAAITNETAGIHGHIVNLPLLMKLFSGQTLEQLTGSKLLDEAPTIAVPNFQFFNNQIAESIRRDEDNQISLNRAVDAIKQDAIIASSISDAMLLKHLNIPIHYWTSSGGIVQLVTSFTVILVIFFCFFHYLKMRKLAIAYAIAQKTPLAQAAVTLLYRQQMITYPTSTSTTTFEQLINMILSRSDKPTWLTIVICTLVLLIMLYFACKHYYTKQKKAKQLSFGLQFISENHHLFISTQLLYGTPTNYHLSFTDAPTAINVSHILFPVLSFNWPSARITDTIMDCNIPISQVINISIREAFYIRQIIETNNYYVIPAFLYRNKIIRPDIVIPLEDRNNPSIPNPLVEVQLNESAM